MGYTALYRKWRSKTFDEVKGQEPITESFKNQIRTGRIGHAYLFCGTRGTGKTSIAKILARAVNCESPVNGNPCNQCGSCKAILEESSMNVIEMDAASNNGVDDIRQIREQVQYPPAEGRYKVYIIDEVHMLSTQAFNAFLKTLEEPPDYVIFALATTEPNKLPVTILSRCQRYDFKRISTEVIADRLREIADFEKIDISDDALMYIARVGDGSMRDSVSLLDQCSSYLFSRRIEYEDALDVLGALDAKVYSDMVRALASRDMKKALTLVGDMVNQGKELGQFVSDFMAYVRNILMAKTVRDLKGIVDMSREDIERLSADQEKLSMDELLRYIRMLSELSNQLRYSSQKRVLIETMLVKLAYPETDVSEEGILSRISALERNANAHGSLSYDGIGNETLAALKQLIASKENGNGAKSMESPVALGENDQRKQHEPVRLPKGQYEDYQRLREQWQDIIAEMDGGLLRASLGNTFVYPDKDKGGMIIATGSRATYTTLSEPDKLAILQNFVSDRFQKEISFSIKYTEDGNEREYSYIADEDLSKINFPVETAEEPPDFI